MLYTCVLIDFIYSEFNYVLFYISGYGDIVFDLCFFGRIFIRVQLILFIFECVIYRSY